MPITPKHSLGDKRPVAARQFTDREDFIAAFLNALNSPRGPEPRVLVYYGVGGIGKSSLRRQLYKLTEGKESLVSAALDFDVANYRDPETALFALRKDLQQRFKCHFPTFDIAYAVYWQKTRPQTPLTKENFALLEDSVHLADIVHLAGEVPLVGTISRLSVLAVKGGVLLKDWWDRRGHAELKGLATMEPLEIADRLPMFWASDLKDFLEQKQRSAVLFLDTYEVLTEGERAEGKLRERDAWVRELVAQLPEVLWVICGREQLAWEKADPEWGKALDQHLIGGLAEKDARQFLGSCGIADPAIQQAIVDGSQGVPYYLDLAVDTWLEIRDRHRREPASEDFARTPLEVFDRFLRHLTHPEVETLKVLSTPRFWDFDLFKSLVSEFQTGYPLTAFAELCRFSFMDEDPESGHWRMHLLMRQSLQEHQAPELKERVHRFLFDHYSRQIQGIDPKNITAVNRAALTEAFFHGQSVLEPSELSKWFAAAAEPFNQFGQNRFLVPLYVDLIPILESDLGPDHPEVANALEKLCWLYGSLGMLLVELPLLQRVLEIREKVLGPNHPKVAIVLHKLAWVYMWLDRFAEAEQVARRSLTINEKALGPDHPDTAVSVQVLGDTYNRQWRFDEAEPLYQRALEIREKRLGPDHIKVADSLQLLASLYVNQGRYAEAETPARRALDIQEKTQGSDHHRFTNFLFGLANLYKVQGRYTEAEPLYQRILMLREKLFGPDIWTAYAQVDLAELYAAQGRCADAETLYRQSLTIFETTLGPDVKWYEAYSLKGLGEINHRAGRFSEAEAFFRQVLELYERKFGPDHGHVAEVLYSMARLRVSQARDGEAEALFRRALGIREKVLKASHPDVAEVLMGLGQLYRKQGRYPEAEPLFLRALEIRERVFGSAHPFVAEVLEEMSKLYDQSGRAAEARALTARAKAIREHDPQTLTPNP